MVFYAWSNFELGVYTSAFAVLAKAGAVGCFSGN
jgi:hypothetical protein